MLVEKGPISGILLVKLGKLVGVGWLEPEWGIQEPLLLPR